MQEQTKDVYNTAPSFSGQRSCELTNDRWSVTGGEIKVTIDMCVCVCGETGGVHADDFAGKCDTNTHAYLSTNIPAWTACTMLRKRGFSSLRRSIRPIWRVKVEASQSRTSEGTDSDWMSLSSSSVSTKRLPVWRREGT